MRCLSFLQHIVFLLAFILFAALLSACAGGAPTVGMSPSSAAEKKAETSACAYSFFLQGRHHELMLRFEQALKAYEQALACDPQSDYISAKIPILLLQLEQDERALSWLEAFLAKHPEHSGMRMLYANILLQEQKNTQAMEQYQLVSDQHPDDPAVLLLLAEMYLADNQLDRAKQVLQGVMRLQPDAYLGHVLTARLATSENDVSTAVVHYKKALAQNWSAELQMEFAELYVSAGLYEQAARLYQSLLKREEFNEEARLALVQLRFLQKKDAAAIAELKRLRNYVDEPQRVDLTIAQLYVRQKQFDKAIVLVREVLEQEDLPAARYFLAALLAQDQQYQEALDQLEQIDEDAQEFQDAFILRIRLLQELNRSDEAVALIEKNLAAPEESSAELYLLFAGLYQLRGESDKAIETMERGTLLFPENAQLLFEYGLLLESAGRRTTALKVMNRVLALEPTHAEALNFIGYVWADKGINLDQALIYLEQAVSLQPDKGHIRDSLGWVYYRVGRLKEAIRELEHALRLGERSPLVFEHLADVYAADRQFQRALERYNKALELLSPEDKEDRERVLDKKADLEKRRTRS